MNNKKIQRHATDTLLSSLFSEMEIIVKHCLDPGRTNRSASWRYETFRNFLRWVSYHQYFKEVFENKLGELPGMAALHLRLDAIPVVMSNRRVRLSVRPQLMEELRRLTKLEAMEPVERSIPWVSQIFPTQKWNGILRICLDPNELNKTLLREHFTILLWMMCSMIWEMSRYLQKLLCP